MKLRVLALGAFLLVSAAVSAQKYSFETVNNDTFVFSDRLIKDMHLKVKNNTASPVGLTWRVIQTIDTNNWGGFAFCDPSLCYYLVDTVSENATEIAGHGTGDFKLSVWARPSAWFETYSVVFWETGNNSVVDTITYVLDARTLGVANEPTARNIHVYPNPSRNVLNLDIPGSKQVTVYDMRGQEVMNEIVFGTKISTESLKAGVYMLQAVSGNEVYRARFVKE